MPPSSDFTLLDIAQDVGLHSIVLYVEATI